MLRLVLALALTGAASATDVITVSGGSFTPPYYLFDGSPDVPTLNEGKISARSTPPPPRELRSQHKLG